MYEEVYAQYYDTAGNYHWTGTMSGTHFAPLDGAIHVNTGSNMSLDNYCVSDNSQGIPQY